MPYPKSLAEERRAIRACTAMPMNFHEHFFQAIFRIREERTLARVTYRHVLARCLSSGPQEEQQPSKEDKQLRICLSVVGLSGQQQQDSASVQNLLDQGREATAGVRALAAKQEGFKHNSSAQAQVLDVGAIAPSP